LTAICLAAGVLSAVIATEGFTLAWNHSVEKTEWQEDYRSEGMSLRLVEARVKGSGAGMEPGADAMLRDGWFRYSPTISVVPKIMLAQADGLNDWRLCVADSCQTLRAWIDAPAGSVVEIRVCRP
jgi:hypothetical protein